jgi:putative endonuclease
MDVGLDSHPDRLDADQRERDGLGQHGLHARSRAVAAGRAAAPEAARNRHDRRTIRMPAGPTLASVPPDPRRATGQRGEALAAALLERRGYVVVERNFRTREGEIDLIALRTGTLVFCEVKTLVARVRGPASGPATPLEAVGPAKRAQVRRVARGWLASHRRGGWRALRFDAIGVLLSPAGGLLELEHVEGAF